MPFKNHYDIDALAPEIMRTIMPFRERHPLTISPSHAALLVIDLQRYFYEPSSHAFIPSMVDIIPKVIQLQQAFTTNNLPLIQTQHCNTFDKAKSMENWWGSILNKNNPFIAIIPQISHPSAQLILKEQYDAFLETNLEQQLHAANITQILITGVMTHLCCDTTARSAFMRGFEVYFVIDATASYNFDFHMASLLNLAHGFAKPIFTTEALKAFAP